MANIEQPADEYRRLLDSVIQAEPEEFEFCGKTRKMGWLHKGTIRRISHVSQKEESPYKQHCKICALMLLNNIWKIRAFYWLLWRWWYYVKDLDEVDILKVMDAGKKKVQREAFFLNTMLLTAMTDLMMTMTKKEAASIQAAQAGEAPSR